jgi:hypothetical protein
MTADYWLRRTVHSQERFRCVILLVFLILFSESNKFAFPWVEEYAKLFIFTQKKWLKIWRIPLKLITVDVALKVHSWV